MIDLKNEKYEIWFSVSFGADYQYYNSHKVVAKSISALARQISEIGCYLPINGQASRLALWRIASEQPLVHQFVCNLIDYPKQTISAPTLKKLLLHVK